MNNEHYIYYCVYSSLLMLVNKNTVVHCLLMLVHSACIKIVQKREVSFEKSLAAFADSTCLGYSQWMKFIFKSSLSIQNTNTHDTVVGTVYSQPDLTVTRGKVLCKSACFGPSALWLSSQCHCDWDVPLHCAVITLHINVKREPLSWGCI